MGKRMIPLVKTNIPDKNILLPELEKVLYSGYVAQGEKVEQFEKEFQKFIGAGYSLSTNSGTAALHIALKLIGVEIGAEVISTALTAEPTNVAIKMTGAKIRYADIDYNTGNIDPDSIEKKINVNTKALVVVDYAGIPVDVARINSLSKKYKIPVIHDAAHSLGATYKGLLAGNHFAYTAFSFQAIKHLTTIDGGLLQIHSEEEYEKAKMIRWFGLNKKIDRLANSIEFQGYKYHMNNVNATIGLVQLLSIQKIIDLYRNNGKYYDEALRNIPGVELIKYYPSSQPSYWLYTMKVQNRNNFIRKMTTNNVTASEVHKRNDYHPFLNDFNENLPMLDKFYKEMVHIPSGWWVTKEEREFIVDLIRRGW